MLNKNLVYALLAIVLAYYYYTNTSPSSRKGTVIETKSGQVKGIISLSRDGREYSSWLKIPFAKPPLNELRFKSPQPIGKWKGVLDGSQYGDKCAQLELFSWTFTGGEDCLFVNVHVPNVEKKDKLLPVLVFIHGGGFWSMGGDQYTPESFMDEEDVILVTLNYRLTLLGFLSSGDEAIRGNMGLKDQVLALKWLKDNIQAFGGDSEKITIFGESAGGVSIHYLLLAEKKTRGLFNKAISMSGTALTPFAYSTSKRSTEQGKYIASKLNCPNGNGQEMVNCLQQVDVRILLETFGPDMNDMSAIHPYRNGDFLRPTIEAIDDEEAFLTEPPYEILRKGKASRVPFMLGITANEGLFQSLAIYRDEKLEFMDENFEELISTQFGLRSIYDDAKANEAARKLQNFYFPSKSGSSYSTQEKLDAYTKLMSDGLFIAGTNEVASIQRNFSDVYTYVYDRPGGPSMTTLIAEFKWRYPFFVELAIFLGNSLYRNYILGEPSKDYGHSAHAQELPMFFPLPCLFPTSIDGKDKTTKDYKFSKDMVRFWTDFAKDETNVQFRGTKLLKLTKEGPLNYLKFDETSEILEEPYKKRSEVWKSIKFERIYSKK